MIGVAAAGARAAADHQGGDAFGREASRSIWTTAYIQRNFGYMVWDTLFAVDEKSSSEAPDGRQV